MAWYITQIVNISSMLINFTHHLFRTQFLTVVFMTLAYKRPSLVGKLEVPVSMSLKHTSIILKIVFHSSSALLLIVYRISITIFPKFLMKIN